MYPRLNPGVALGFEILGFSQFGKDVNQHGTPLSPSECKEQLGGMTPTQSSLCGHRDPYNHIGETVGLNTLGLSFTRPLARFNLMQSNLLFTFNGGIGWVGDSIPQFYQNEVIHRSLGLQRIPREKVACENSNNILECWTLSMGGELNYQFHSLDRARNNLGLRKSPLFVGAGALFSNIFNDAYVQAGVKRYELWGNAWPKIDRVVSLAFSAMVRGGVLAKGLVFEDPANQYFIADGSVALLLARHHFPITLEFGLSGTTGAFVNRPRRVVDNREDQTQHLPKALAERFYHFRVEIGEFVFETYNDSPGGKDKGPSFGARVFYTFVPGTWEGNFMHLFIPKGRTRS